MFVPKTFLKQLYTNGSLANTDDGVRFELKNRLLDAKLVAVTRIVIDGRDVPLDRSTLGLEDGRVLSHADVASAAPLAFDLGDVYVVGLAIGPLSPGSHTIEIQFESQPFGTLTIDAEDTIAG
jgi:hydroxymethylglutaryl-CoA reductase (NADPH)